MEPDWAAELQVLLDELAGAVETSTSQQDGAAFQVMNLATQCVDLAEGANPDRRMVMRIILSKQQLVRAVGGYRGLRRGLLAVAPLVAPELQERFLQLWLPLLAE